MSLGALADDFARRDLKGGKQAGQTVPPVVVSVASRSVRSERQHRLRAFQRLDLRLLVHAQNHCVCRGIQVQTHNVANLLFGFGVRRELEGLDAMGLQCMRSPNAANRARRDTNSISHFARAPLAQAARRSFQGQGHDTSALGLRDRRRATRTRLVQQPLHSLFDEASTDAADLDGRVAGQLSDFRARNLIGQQQDGSCPPTDAGGRRWRALQLLQLRAVASLQHDGSGVIGHALLPREYTASILS